MARLVGMDLSRKGVGLDVQTSALESKVVGQPPLCPICAADRDLLPAVVCRGTFGGRGMAKAQFFSCPSSGQLIGKIVKAFRLDDPEIGGPVSHDLNATLGKTAQRF